MGLFINRKKGPQELQLTSPGLGRSPGAGNGNLLQYYCLENPMDRGAWQAAVYGVAKSQTRFHFHFHPGPPEKGGLELGPTRNQTRTEPEFEFSTKRR